MPSPRFKEKEFVSWLIKSIQEHNIDLVIPAFEEIFVMAKYKDKVQKACPATKILADDYDKLLNLHNKQTFMKTAESLGITIPKTHVVKTQQEIETVLSQNPSQHFFLKPAFSRGAAEAHKINAQSDLSQIDLHNSTWLLQEYVEGDLVCFYGFAKNGKPIFHVTYENAIDTLVDGEQGAVPFFSHTKDDAPVVEAVNKIIRNCNFCGNISFDFIRRNGVYYALECNPRPTGGYNMLAQNNLYQLMTQGVPEKGLKIRRCQCLKLLNLLTFNRYSPSYLWATITFHDVLFDWTDPKPAFQFKNCLAGVGKMAKENNLTFVESMFFDISYDD